MTKTGLASSVVAVVLLASGAASAQASADSPQWLKDRQYTQGAGVQTGDFELHPGIGGQVGYDSNWFLRSSNPGYANSAPLAPVMSAAEFHITPSLYLSTVRSRQREEHPAATLPPMLSFRAGVSATYLEFVGLSSDQGNPANDISGQRNLGISADTRLDVAPGRPVGLSLFANYGRTIQPNAVTADPNLSFVYDTITAGTQLNFQPGRGTLSWQLGYQFQDSIFETSEGSPYDNLSHQGFLRGQWRFRPRTSLKYEVTIDHTEFLEAQEDAIPSLLLSSTPVRARFGINGLITDRFAAEATGGWGATFFNQVQTFPAEPQYDSFIGHAELKWFLAASPGIAEATKLGLALSSIAIGYDRDFQSSYLGSYFGTDRGYLKFSYLFAGRALVTLEGGAGTIEYPELFWSDFTERHPSFTDIRMDATLFGEYRFTDSLAINVTLRYSANFSKNQLELSNTPPAGESITSGANLFDMSWKRFESYLGLRWFL